MNSRTQAQSEHMFYSPVYRGRPTMSNVMLCVDVRRNSPIMRIWIATPASVALVLGVILCDPPRGERCCRMKVVRQQVILILGGVDKGNDYNLLKDLVREKVKAIVCLGTDNRKIHESFGEVVSLMVNTENAQDAVQAAFHFANKGDVVLLSPACASFDLFKNYEDRGNQFKQAVKNL